MADPETQSAVDQLDALLEEERDALLSGDLERLNDMLPSKEALITTLNTDADTDHPGLQHLNIKVRRNQLLLDGALEGIRAVAKKMAHIRETRGAIETYDAEGRKKIIPAETERSVEKRA
jgi:flagellar biosynthesis/type III secretory pathway chaperone